MSSNVLSYPRKIRKICCILARSLKFRQLVLELLSMKFYETPLSLSSVVTYVFIKGQTGRYTINIITCWEGTFTGAYWLPFFRKAYFDRKNNKQLFCCELTLYEMRTVSDDTRITTKTNVFVPYLCIKWYFHLRKKVKQPVTGLECPRKFQEVKVPRLHDNGAGWW